MDPVASGESGWLAQVQGALQNVQQDLNAISSDASNDPDNLALDGSQLMTDAQAALDPNYDPPPADNADWVAAMNDYVTAGEDYSDENTNEQDDNPAQASQEIAAGNAALAQIQRRQRRGTERDHPVLMIRSRNRGHRSGERRPPVADAPLNRLNRRLGF